MFLAFKKITVLLLRILRQVSPKLRFRVAGSLFLTLLASMLEVVSIGTLIPFLAVMIEPQKVFDHHALNSIFIGFGLLQSDQILWPLTLLFLIATLISVLVRMTLLYVQAHLGQAIIHEFTVKIYEKILFLPYVEHINIHNSEKFLVIVNKTESLVNQVFIPTLTIINSVTMGIFIFIALMVVNFEVAVFAFLVLGAIYTLIIYFVKLKLLKHGNQISKNWTLGTQALNEGLGGIRDILLDKAQKFYIDAYENIDRSLRHANANVQVLGAFPRILVEAIGMAFIILTALFLVKSSSNFIGVFPILGAFALGAQRLLPYLQQAYQAWTSILSGINFGQGALDMLEKSDPRLKTTQIITSEIVFERKISLAGISHSYGDRASLVLDDINLEIMKGSKVGIIGSTGGGKSTLLDIMMGLIEPTKGSLLVDDQLINLSNADGWQLHLAHVPQAIFLADVSIAENIALGLPLEKINFDLIKKVALKANISDVIESWPNQYMTKVGERGVQLSGGQRQRIGIARALYKQADVIIFDEATSALDNETEAAIMNSIEDSSRTMTVIMVAHRLNTLKSCDQIIRIENGAVKDILTYAQLMKLNGN